MLGDAGHQVEENTFTCRESVVRNVGPSAAKRRSHSRVTAPRPEVDVPARRSEEAGVGQCVPLALLPPTRFPTSGGSTVGAGAPGRARICKLLRLFLKLSGIVVLLTAAAYMEGMVQMSADAAVNLAVAIGVAVGGRVGGSAPAFSTTTMR
jgi:hypothetical protein